MGSQQRGPLRMFRSSGFPAEETLEFCVPLRLPILLWRYCPEHDGVKEKDRAERISGEATVTGGLRFRRSEVLRSLRHYLWTQSQGQGTIEERSIKRRYSFSGRKRAIVNQTNSGTVSKATSVKLLKDGTELNWPGTELTSTRSYRLEWPSLQEDRHVETVNQLCALQGKFLSNQLKLGMIVKHVAASDECVMILKGWTGN